MAKEKEDRLKKVLQDMSFSLKHIEDIMADDRALLVKLVKQNNTIVDYLKQLEIEVVEDYGLEEPLPVGVNVNLQKDKQPSGNINCSLDFSTILGLIKTNGSLTLITQTLLLIPI